MKPTTFRFAIAVLASMIAAMTLTPTAQAQRRGTAPTGRDDGGLAGAGIPLMTTQRIVSAGLVRPIFVTYAPGDPTRLFIIEKQGRIRVLKINVNPPQLLATPFLDIDSQIAGGIGQSSEQGLLGLAFHPNYAANGTFYVFYTALSFANTVARFQKSANPDIADGSNTTGSIVIQQPDNESNHNGGWIGFKPGDTQGLLYVSMGDGGGSCDLNLQHDPVVGNGQSLDTLFGKMLRIDVDGADGIPGNDDDDGVLGNGSSNGHRSPTTNPFFGLVTGLDQIWSYGLRNAWRCSFDRATGDLYIADVGQWTWEEVNFQPSAATGGRNYGWRCFEGTVDSSVSCGSQTTCVGVPSCSSNGMTCPIYQYNHDTAVCSITGGYVYRGPRMPSLQGTYFFADYNCSFVGEAPIWSFKYTGGAVTNFQVRTAELDPDGIGAGVGIDTLTSFGEDYYGEIYICDQEGGEIFKIVPRCAVDSNFDGSVNVTDLLAVISAWGPCPPPSCPPDSNGDGQVNVTDLLAVISFWGPCNP